MQRGRRPGDSLWAQISDELANAPPDVSAVLSRLTRTLSRVQPGTWVALVMNPEPTTSRMVVADDADRAMAEYVERFIAAANHPAGTPTFGLAQQVIESGKPIIWSRVPFAELIAAFSPAAKAYYAAYAPPAPIEAVGLLIVPMRVGGATIGALGIFEWHHESQIGEGDVAWLQAVADRAALALDHARLYSAERRLVERLDVIGNVVLAAGYGQDLRLALRVIVEEVTARLEADAADILLLQGQAAGLAVAASAGFHTSAAEGHPVPMDSDLFDPASVRVRIVHMTDGEAMRRNPRRSAFAREGFQTYVQIALRPRGELIGVLEIFNRSPLQWDQGSLEFFETYAGIAAMAIDYAILTAPRGSLGAGTPMRGNRPDLTELELTIVRLMVEGLNNREISERVHRSESTIKAHVRRILDKTETINRTDLAHKATMEGWL